MVRITSTIIGILVAGSAWAQSPAVIALIEEDTDLLVKQLTNDGAPGNSQVSRELRDFYCGISALRVTSFQRYATKIDGWNYPIVETPKAGQYRYLRFAWKREGGPGIAMQLCSNGNWDQRYLAGERSKQTATWGAMISLSDKPPREWTVVTRDLFKDFGPLTIRGIALTPMDGGVAGLFDHVYLGRTIADLDRASDEAFGKTPLAEPLSLLELGELWEELAKPDASDAVRKLLAGRKESVPYLATMARIKPRALDKEQVARWIRDLDDEAFLVREAAHKALDALGDAVISPLQEARMNAHSQEHRNRIDALLKNRGVEEGRLTNQQLRLLRAVRILEWSGTKEGFQALDGLVKEPPDAVLLPDIRAARERVNR